ncbi:MAG: DUF4982 domain-containing protein [Holosporaceae bacterium]|nr:DUF4982 domain-containing protein [Holosporaceae bacterium]
MAQDNNTGRRTIPLTDNWKFIKSEQIFGGERPNYDDSNWRTVEIPHDWSIENLPNQKSDDIIGPFDRTAISGKHTGYTVGGTAWYRKTFELNQNDEGKTVYLYFEGVYMNSDVWINGYHLGNHPHGYTSFYFDISLYLNPAGEKNTIAVEVKNEGVNSRWYSGSGIYRDAWITIVERVHIKTWGVAITTPRVSESSSDVKIVSSIVNTGLKEQKVTLLTQLIDKEGNIVGSSIDNINVVKNRETEISQTITVSNPALWSCEEPNLYKAIVTVIHKKKHIDKVTETFGIRDVKISAEEGLLINGKNVLIKGGCIHHDNGMLGAVAIDRAEERKVELLKENGFNAIRMSHNPSSTKILEVCDRLGMLVIDEAFDMWMVGKNESDYHLFFNKSWEKDLESMLLRDRNHPSIFLWSVGNEIPERIDSLGLVIRKALVDKVYSIDPTRKTTEALCLGANWDKGSAAAFAQLDVAGYNYLNRAYKKHHSEYPDRIILGTETLPKQAYKEWKLTLEYPCIIGGFVWTAMDYLGEAAIGSSSLMGGVSDDEKWPWFNAYCGDIDIIGEKKPQKAYRDVIWDISPIEMNVHAPMPKGTKESVSAWGWPEEWPHWNWEGHEGETFQVRVFTKAPTVRLMLNGTTLEDKKLSDNDEYIASFDVPYQPGELVAVGIDDGKEIGRKGIKTSGKTKSIKLTADRHKIKADRHDLSFVKIEVVDENGLVVPSDSIKLKLSVAGDGEIAASGNANPKDMASFNALTLKTYKGKAQAILRPFSKGKEIVLRVESEGLKGREISIELY